MPDTITCPSCQAEIEITEALSARLMADLRRRFDKERKLREAELEKREAELDLERKALDSATKSLEEQIVTRLDAEREELLKKASEKAKEDVAAQLQEQSEELSEAKQKLKVAQAAEMEIRKKARELEEQKEEFDLTIARKLDEERKKIRDDAKREAQAERELKDAEKDKIIGDLRKEIADLQRKSEQGSQQLQGEVMELSLEEQLKRLFPLDSIDPVPKGVHGGDVIHEVHDGIQSMCGSILWESKRTKNWSDSWLPKLRDDQRAAKAQVAVIVTAELPPGITTFGQIDGVWICGWQYAMPLAAVLRNLLAQVAYANRALEGRHDKMELLYQYLAGPEFKHRIEGIVEAFVTLREDLEKERRSMERIWSRREKQLRRAVVNTAGMYGDLQGIVGASLPHIEQLRLPQSDECQEEPTEHDSGKNE